jgi:hypothetical protein
MTSLELAQENVAYARMRLDLVRSFVRGSRLSSDRDTEASALQLLTTLEQSVRLYEDHWEYLLREEDRLSTMNFNAAFEGRAESRPLNFRQT